MIFRLFFKKIPIYVKIYTNQVEVINLKTGETASGREKFSTARIVVSDFNTIELLIRDLVGKVTKKRFFPPQLTIAVQQMEKPEDGLSEIERRALRDMTEQAGGVSVKIVEHNRNLSNEEALEELKSTI